MGLSREDLYETIVNRGEGESSPVSARSATIEKLRPIRDELQSHVDAFLASGGRIQQIPTGIGSHNAHQIGGKVWRGYDDSRG